MKNLICIPAEMRSYSDDKNWRRATREALFAFK
jgi:hypothetical protein